MYKSLLLLFIAIKFLGTLNAQKIETRELSDFSIIKVKSGIKVFIHQADTFSVTVKADHNATHRIITERINNTLTISTKGRYRWKNQELREVHISLPEIISLSAVSGGHIKSTNLIQADVIFLRASSGSDIYCNIAATSIKANASNGGSITLIGNCKQLNSVAQESGHIFTKKLSSEFANVSADYGSIAEVNVSKWLHATSTGGEIKFKGDPVNRNFKATKGGDIRRF